MIHCKIFVNWTPGVYRSTKLLFAFVGVLTEAHVQFSCMLVF